MSRAVVTGTEMCAVSDVCEGVCRKLHRIYGQDVVKDGSGKKHSNPRFCPALYVFIPPKKEEREDRRDRDDD